MARRGLDDLSTNSDSDYSKHFCKLYKSKRALFIYDNYTTQWISWFLSSKGNEYFCQVEEDYILDRFNLTGLNAEVQNYSQALDLITDNLDDEIEEEFRGSIEVSARFLYGLIHARWIITTRGLAKMLEKYKKAEFGRCPRVLCQSQPLLPVGLTDVPYEKSVKLYCGRCEDIYSPKSSRHGSIDGAYFGSSFPHMLFLVYPWILPTKYGVHDLSLSSVNPEAGRGRRRERTDEGLHLSGHGLSALASSNTVVASREKEERASTAPSASGTAVGEDQPSTVAVALGAERYRPKIFGFQISEIAKLQRWQEAIRDRQIARLEAWERRED